MEDKAYEQQEVRRAQHRLDQIEKAPLTERREAERDFAEALTHPGCMGRNLAWLLCGHYGYGEMILAQRVLLAPRMNHVAALGQFLAAWDYGCPSGFARRTWNALPQAHKDRVIAEMQSAIADWQKERTTP